MVQSLKSGVIASLLFFIWHKEGDPYNNLKKK